MIKQALMPAVLIFAALSGAIGQQAEAPFESGRFVPAGRVDVHVLAALHKHGIQPANRCSDAVFLRRVYLDLIGTPPTPLEARRFLQDRSPDKRAALIEELLTRQEFAHYWTMKWCDLLRVKAEFPINLWPNAVQAYHRWILAAVRDNMPYDRFARELLTSSGSNFRVPQVNFYRATQGRDLSAIAGAVALTFMGTRLDSWPEERRTQMAGFFSRVAYKKTGEWKEEIVYLDPTAVEPLNLVLPDGTAVKVTAGQDPRQVFADWLLAPDNPWFARSIVNRIWSWFMGRGIIHEPDDIRDDNAPVNPELLAYLESELVASGYDLRHIYRLILNSCTYQQSSVPQADHEQSLALFACYPIRQLDAEVLIDALCWIGGDGQGYSSAAPEPFTFIPESHRAITVADGSITSAFLEMFGRPARDTGLESERSSQPTDAQRLYLLNSSDVRRKIEQSRLLRQITQLARGNRETLISGIYLAIVSRYPTPEELAVADKHFETDGLSQKQAVDDLAWALINSKEFLYRH